MGRRLCQDRALRHQKLSLWAIRCKQQEDIFGSVMSKNYEQEPGTIRPIQKHEVLLSHYYTAWTDHKRAVDVLDENSISEIPCLWLLQSSEHFVQ